MLFQWSVLIGNWTDVHTRTFQDVSIIGHAQVFQIILPPPTVLRLVWNYQDQI